MLVLAFFIDILPFVSVKFCTYSSRFDGASKSMAGSKRMQKVFEGSWGLIAEESSESLFFRFTHSASNFPEHSGAIGM